MRRAAKKSAIEVEAPAPRCDLTVDMFTPTDGRLTRPHGAIVIGKRHRKDFGDLDGLAGSIDARRCLLQPIVIRPNNQLIDGERRWRAWPLTRFRDQEIPVHVVDVDSIVAGEWDANALRKPFTLSECVAIADELEPMFKAAARERQAHGSTAPGRKKQTEAAPAAGRAAAQTANALGKSHVTIERAREIVRAAEREPERFARLVEDMDRTGRVHGPYRRLINQAARDKILQAPPGLPDRGPYYTIVVDLPWPDDPERPGGPADDRAYFPYPTMSIADMCLLAVPAIMHPDHCSVWFWTTNFHLINGYAKAVLDAWGLDPVTMLTWVKNKIGQGARLRGQTEHCILAIRGRPPVLATGQGTVIHADVREHSRKPDEFYAIVEAVSPAPVYAELFARRELPANWHGHGNQVGTFANA